LKKVAPVYNWFNQSGISFIFSAATMQQQMS